MKLLSLIFVASAAAAAILLLGPAVDAQWGPYIEPCRNDQYPPDENDKIPTLIVNLDLAPEQRWAVLAAQYSAGIKDVIAEVIALVPALLRPLLLFLVDSELPKVMAAMPAEYAAEIRGIATASNLPLGQILLFNIFYEFDAMCTSIIARDGQNKIWHARNLDFGLFMGWDKANDTWSFTEKLRKIIANVDFQSAGKTVFKGTQFVGYVGGITGVRPGAFSITMNERYEVRGGWWGIIQWLRGDHNASWSGFLFRQTLQYATTFEQARDTLRNTPMLASAYFIVAGTQPNDGCVITRDQTSVLEERCLNDTQWWVLETNYDWWKKPLFIDDRRTPTIKCMTELGAENTNFTGLFNVLNTKPILNKLTTYTALIDVASGDLMSYQRFCTGYCWPW